MSQLFLSASGLVKSFGDRKLIDISSLFLYEGQRVGLVGANGSGKTTLLHLLAGTLEPDGGSVRRLCTMASLSQFGGEAACGDLGKWTPRGTFSGGEQMRQRIAAATRQRARLLLADEPTANLDTDGVRLVRDELLRQDSLILVSHDRQLLTQVCTHIWALEDGMLLFYEGGFEEYTRQRALRRERQQAEYEAFTQERRRLEAVFVQKKRAAAAVARPSGNMSPSERHLRDFTSIHKSTDSRQRALERAARNVQTRIDHLAVKEAPRTASRADFDFALTDPPRGKTVLSAQELHFSYPGSERVLLRAASLRIAPGDRVALCGKNGSGKTTLLALLERYVRDGDLPPGVRGQLFAAPKARIGRFEQSLENLNLEKSALENVLDGAVQSESAARAILGRLLLADKAAQRAGTLSGGERIRLSFAKLLASPANVLFLDEPTNYLDLPSIEALQEVVSTYEGTVLFVSHDRAFSDAAATHTLLISGGTLDSFFGSPSAYEAARRAPKPAAQDERRVLEHRLCAVVGRLSGKTVPDKEALEVEYATLLTRLRELKG